MKIILLLISLLFLSPNVYGEKYSINVTKEADNLYRIDGSNIYIKTSMCYEMAYSEKAILNNKGYGDELIFPDQSDGTTYQILKYYKKTELEYGSLVKVGYGSLEEADSIFTPTNFNLY